MEKSLETDQGAQSEVRKMFMTRIQAAIGIIVVGVVMILLGARMQTTQGNWTMFFGFIPVCAGCSAGILAFTIKPE